jgi:uncharacterized protein YbaA (DUF1428 family)
MAYVHGMVAAVPLANREAFVRMCQQMAPIFRKHGALEVADCWGDAVPEGEVTSFPRAVRCSAKEAVAFSWIVWPDKETAEAGMEAAMSDPDMPPVESLPFDGKRLIYGGFERIS